MGLFSSVLHLRETPREDVLAAIDAVLRNEGFSRTMTSPVTKRGPHELPDCDASPPTGPQYLISPLHGTWLTIIELHAVRDAPHIVELGKRLSAALSTYALALVVHDDDVFFYNLDRNGESLDGYNSCPQYFEQQRLPKSLVEEQRHTVQPFEALLPLGQSLQDLESLLNRGWWNAYDTGKLDEYGVPRDKRDGFVFEGERMTAFGTLLQIHGTNGEYPYAAWAESKHIDWPKFVAVGYVNSEREGARP